MSERIDPDAVLAKMEEIHHRMDLAQRELSEFMTKHYAERDRLQAVIIGILEESRKLSAEIRPEVSK